MAQWLEHRLMKLMVASLIPGPCSKLLIIKKFNFVPRKRRTTILTNCWACASLQPKSEVVPLFRDGLERSPRVFFPVELQNFFTESNDLPVELKEEAKLRKAVEIKIAESNGRYSLILNDGEIPKRIINDMLANGSSTMSLDIMPNSPRQYMMFIHGMMNSKFHMLNYPLGFIFRDHCPWVERIIQKSDQMVQAGIYVKIIYQTLTTHKQRVKIMIGEVPSIGPILSMLNHFHWEDKQNYEIFKNQCK